MMYSTTGKPDISVWLMYIQFEPPPLYDITMLLFHSPFLPLLDGSVSESKRIAAMKKGLQDLEVIEEREKKKDIHT